MHHEYDLVVIGTGTGASGAAARGRCLQSVSNPVLYAV